MKRSAHIWLLGTFSEIKGKYQLSIIKQALKKLSPVAWQENFFDDAKSLDQCSVCNSNPQKIFECQSTKSNSKRILILELRVKTRLVFLCIFWLSEWLMANTSGRWQFEITMGSHFIHRHQHRQLLQFRDNYFSSWKVTGNHSQF